MCHVLFGMYSIYCIVNYRSFVASFLQRETIVKLVSIERGDSFCYVVVSKGGRVGIYSGLLKLMCSYEVSILPKKHIYLCCFLIFRKINVCTRFFRYSTTEAERNVA